MRVVFCDYCGKKIQDEKRMKAGSPGFQVKLEVDGKTFQVSIGPAALDHNWNTIDLHKRCAIKIIKRGETT